MLGFIIWIITRERNLLKKHLVEEVNNGLISPSQYKTAISFFQAGTHLSALSSGTFRQTSRFYQICGELAHKKEQLVKVGDERGNMQIVEQYRAELSQLAPRARA
jgi:hypothetical protein